MDRLRRIIIFLVCALFLTAPLVLYPHFPSSRVFQIYYIQIIAVLISILLFLYLALSKNRIRLSLLDTSVLFYLITILLSSISSQDYIFTLKESLFPISGILVYFIITRTFRDLSDVKKLYVILVICATLTSIYGMLQYFNIDFIKWEKAHLREKYFIIAMLSHPNFVAIYIAPIIPIIIYFLFSVRYTSLRILLSLSLLVNIVCLKFTGARGSWLGAIIALIVSVFVFLFLIRKDEKFKSVLRKGFVIGLVFVILLSLFTFRHKRFTVGERIGDVSTILTRFYTWILAVEMIKDKPLLGVGYGNYQVQYFDYVDKTQKDEQNKNYVQLLELSKERMSPRTYNDYLQTATETGIIGLCAFLFMLIIILFEMIQLIKHSPHQHFKFLSLAQLASIIVILTDALFNFPFLLPNTIILFWGIVGTFASVEAGSPCPLIWAREPRPYIGEKSGDFDLHTPNPSQEGNCRGRIYASRSREGNFKKYVVKFSPNFSRIIFVLLMLIGLFVLFILWGRFLSMNYYYLAEGLNTKYLDKKKLFATKSVVFDSTNGASHMILGSVSLKEGDYLNALSRTSRAKLTYSSVNLFTQFSLIYQKLGNYPLAIDYFKIALRIYPADIDTILGLGSVYYFLKDYKSALEVFKKGLVYEPFNVDLYLSISEAYVKLGELDNAISQLRAVLNIQPENIKALENLAMIYVDKGIYLDEAITILRGIIRGKQDVRYYTALSIAYDKKGDYINAMRSIKRALTLAPDNKKANEIEKVLSGKYGL